MDKELTSLPNIGPVLAENLCAVGLDTTEKFRAAGRPQRRFCEYGPKWTQRRFHQLTALAGAELDMPRKMLTPAQKQGLRAFLTAFKTAEERNQCST